MRPAFYGIEIEGNWRTDSLGTKLLVHTPFLYHLPLPDTILIIIPFLIPVPPMNPPGPVVLHPSLLFSFLPHFFI